ncbi:hypothetical protein [Mycobacteroides saopaulense]|uniref:Uncharacterized protein n=1 Tax=Mycobacteroides saopaulense TaxID=1578165 RepID=A0ABX3BYA9_9MYCO|nr:hypothetical protein [Mycobacteroides saopaulense]OHT86882.1 hypothetical protein BKG68_12405 [Mycobacteroides saopaulense]OHU08737.1 hypothetical protein BKG73_17095 [Mycobacteroides saopaulense]
MQIPKKLRIAVSLTAEKILVPPLEFLYWAMGYPKTLFVVLWVAVVSTVTVFLTTVFDMPFPASALLASYGLLVTVALLIFIDLTLILRKEKRTKPNH